MRIAVNLRVWRPMPAYQRKLRRLAYVARILADMGHDVAIHVTKPGWTYDPPVQTFAFMRHVAKINRTESADGCEAYVCSHPTVVNSPHEIPADAKVVAFKDALDISPDCYLAARCAAIVSYVWHPDDFARSAPSRPKFDLENAGLIRSKVLSVPWIPHEVVLDRLDKDGMTLPYLTDGLATLREKYHADGGRWIGFCGSKHFGREELARSLAGPSFEFAWSEDSPMQPDAYLRWLSGCRAVLNLPGDTWKCSRFCEAIMMGVPVIQQEGRMVLSPQVTADNAIMVMRWDDPGPMVAAAEDRERLASIRKHADEAYLAGWSLRGQVAQILRRIGHGNADVG